MEESGEKKEREENKAQQKPKTSGVILLENAIRSHIQGDLNKAEKAYRAAIDSGLVNATLFSNLGIICQASQRTEEAVSLYEKAIHVNPNHPDAYTNLGGLHKKLGNLDQALAFTLKSLELKPDNPDALINLGSIYKKLGNLDQALAYTLKSLELKPDNPDALINLGSIYKDLGNLDQALVATLKSLELNPNNPTAHMNLGSVYKDLGNLDQALASTLKSLELNPNNPTAHMNLGSVYKDLGNLDQALVSTLKSLELNPNNPTAHMNLGDINQELGKLDQALASTLKSLELKPENPIAYMNLGSIYKNLDTLDQALTSTLKSLELKPDNPTAHMNLGSIYKDLGNLNQALTSTLKSLELKPDNPTAHMNLGSIYKDLGNLDKALIAAKKGIELDPHNLNCYILLSCLCLKAKNPIQAKEVCEQGLRISSNNTRLQNNLSIALGQITPLWHITMMNDADRNRYYAEAINKAVKPNDLVLDIGAGAGLLSMMAAEAGASEVIACEMVIPIASKAQDLVRKNGFEDKIKIFGVKSTNVKIGKEMPRKADVIISEIFSSEMVGEGILATLQDSRERLLKDGGLMIPERAEIKFALLGESPEVNRLTKPGYDSCYFLGDFAEVCTRKIPAQLTERPNLLSEPKSAFHFDFRKPLTRKSEKTINTDVTKDGNCIGIVQWLKTNLFDHIIYENTPGEVSSHWSSNVYLFQNPICVRQGQSISIDALADEDLLWFQHSERDSQINSNR